MKYEWRKRDKALYLPPNEPVLIDVPACNYYCITGEGNPNSPAFEEKIGLLYTLSFGLKSMLKKEGTLGDGYTVFPLEAIWRQKGQGVSDKFDKNNLEYLLMIRQPDNISIEQANANLELVENKKPQFSALIKEVEYKEITDGLCVQMMHIGAYDIEDQSFKRMEDYCGKNGLSRKLDSHREIYITNTKTTHPSKLKTVLRYGVEHQ